MFVRTGSAVSSLPQSLNPFLGLGGYRGMGRKATTTTTPATVTVQPAAGVLTLNDYTSGQTNPSQLAAGDQYGVSISGATPLGQVKYYRMPLGTTSVGTPTTMGSVDPYGNWTAPANTIGSSLVGMTLVEHWYIDGAPLASFQYTVVPAGTPIQAVAQPPVVPTPLPPVILPILPPASPLDGSPCATGPSCAPNEMCAQYAIAGTYQGGVCTPNVFTPIPPTVVSDGNGGTVMLVPSPGQPTSTPNVIYPVVQQTGPSGILTPLPPTPSSTPDTSGIISSGAGTNLQPASSSPGAVGPANVSTSLTAPSNSMGPIQTAAPGSNITPAIAPAAASTDQGILAGIEDWLNPTQAFTDIQAAPTNYSAAPMFTIGLLVPVAILAFLIFGPKR